MPLAGKSAERISGERTLCAPKPKSARRAALDPSDRLLQQPPVGAPP
jgi:hypothetical protein